MFGNVMVNAANGAVASMSIASTDVVDDGELVELLLDIWHPDCWTLELTESGGAGLLGYGTTPLDARAGTVGYYTVYGQSADEVDGMLESMRSCSAIAGVHPQRFGPAIAPVTTNVIVRTRSAGGMRAALRAHGFLHLGPTRHQDGRERRMVVTELDRGAIRSALEQLESDFGADIEIERIGRLDGAPGGRRSLEANDLSVRQREAFRLARDRGSYEYPRAVTADTLADELGIARSTYLEHLHKAERKLLSGMPI